MTTFAQQLEVGKTGEGIVATWLKAKGYSILPAYDIEIPHGKGPQFYTPEQSLVSPDMQALIVRNGQTFGMWVEAKTKTRFTWYRKARAWQTGIDLRHYNDYIEVQRISGLPVWLVFVHQDSTPSKDDMRYGCPPECPAGLFFNRLDVLQVSAQSGDDRYYTRNGRTYPMVYWNVSDLRRDSLF